MYNEITCTGPAHAVATIAAKTKTTFMIVLWR